MGADPAAVEAVEAVDVEEEEEDVEVAAAVEDAVVDLEEVLRLSVPV